MDWASAERGNDSGSSSGSWALTWGRIRQSPSEMRFRVHEPIRCNAVRGNGR